MIISFYDKDFNGLQDNASLVIDDSSYSLIRRGVEMDELKCTCEAFTEDIQPAFIVVKNDVGKYVYSCLAGIPELTEEKKTQITGTDLKAMLKSDILKANVDSSANVNYFLTAMFNLWKSQVVQGTINCELVFDSAASDVDFDDLDIRGIIGVVDVWEDIFAPHLRYYGLYMTAKADIVNKKITFTIGKAMRNDLNVKLWEHGIYNYGKWVANVNETVGVVYIKSVGVFTTGTPWILLSDNQITTSDNHRDIFPVKRRIVYKEIDEYGEYNEDLTKAESDVRAEALELLTQSMFAENIEIEGVNADFETNFKVYTKRGQENPYKSLPCGELHYDTSGLKKIQIGYRFSGLQFII